MWQVAQRRHQQSKAMENTRAAFPAPEGILRRWSTPSYPLGCFGVHGESVYPRLSLVLKILCPLAKLLFYL